MKTTPQLRGGVSRAGYVSTRAHLRWLVYAGVCPTWLAQRWEDFPAPALL